jgi:hypothetical protein
MEQNMQNKNPGSGNWKDKLEDTTAFAGNELLNTNAAWDKLYNRLHQPRRKKAVWYWAAAACLAMVIASVLFVSKQKIQNRDTATNRQQTEKPIAAVKENEQAAAITTTEKKESVKKNIKQINTAAAVKNSTAAAVQIPQPFAVNDNDKAMQQSITLLPAAAKQVNDTASSTQIVSVQPKTKLKVVHVNELGNDNIYSNKPSGDYSVIQFGVSNQQVYNKVPVPSGKIGFNISTSKTSPSN